MNLDGIKSPALRKAILGQIAADDLARKLFNAKSQSVIRPALDHPAPGKEKGSKRITVRITRCARKLLDADNLGGAKYIIDRLRYEGAINNDDPGSIELLLDQEKVRTKKEEGTRIELA